MPILPIEIQQIILDHTHPTQLFLVGCVCRAWWEHLQKIRADEKGCCRDGDTAIDVEDGDHEDGDLPDKAVERYVFHRVKSRIERVTTLNAGRIYAPDLGIYDDAVMDADRDVQFRNDISSMPMVLSEYVAKTKRAHEKLAHCLEKVVNRYAHHEGKALPYIYVRENFVCGCIQFRLHNSSLDQYTIIHFVELCLRGEHGTFWLPVWNKRMRPNIVAVRACMERALGRIIPMDKWWDAFSPLW